MPGNGQIWRPAVILVIGAIFALLGWLLNNVSSIQGDVKALQVQITAIQVQVATLGTSARERERDLMARLRILERSNAADRLRYLEESEVRRRHDEEERGRFEFRQSPPPW